MIFNTDFNGYGGQEYFQICIGFDNCKYKLDWVKCNGVGMRDAAIKINRVLFFISFVLFGYH